MIAATTLFVGCINDSYREDIPGEEEKMGSVYIRFRMSLNTDGTRSASSRAGEGAAEPITGETPGTGPENRINTVDLLVYDTTDKLIDIIYLNETQTAAIGSEGGVCIPISAQKGQTVRIYAMVNMTHAMRRLFTIGSGLDMAFSAVCNESDYTKVIDEFIPGSGGKEETLTGGIPMTGQFKIGISGEGGTDIMVTDEHPTNDKALQVKADITRLMSKIHVLATPLDATTPIYARALHNSSETATASNSLGWIRMENVRYMPNGINRSSYILPQTNVTATSPTSTQLKDLNMSLDGYISGEAFDTQMCDNDYVFLKGEAFHRANIDGVMARAEAYDADRLARTAASNDPDRYVSGMYCPENYFDVPQNATIFEDYGDAIPMITHVYIATKLTPRVILIGNDYKTKMQTFVDQFLANPELFRTTYGLSETDFTHDHVTYWDGMKDKLDVLPVNHGCLEFRPDNEEEARFIINGSLKMNKQWDPNASDFAAGKYSDGTYYVYDQQYDGAGYEGPRYLFLTAGAVAESKGVYITIKARSVPHLGGWGYYYTYIDDNGTTLNGVTPYTASQVTRNKYYIITVSNFGVPGGTITEPEYIKVNTESVNWDYSGSGHINLH